MISFIEQISATIEEEFRKSQIRGASLEETETMKVKQRKVENFDYFEMDRIVYDYCGKKPGTKCLKDCDTKLIHQLSEMEGFGSHMNRLLLRGIYAIYLNQTMVINFQNWNYGDWFLLFDSESLNCTQVKPPYGFTLALIPTANQDVGALEIRLTETPNPYLPVPLGVYKHLGIQRLVISLVWKLSHGANSRLKEELDQVFHKFLKDEKSESLTEFYGIQIRKGDKLTWREAYSIPLEKYLEIIERIHSSLKKEKGIKFPLVFVASDDLNSSLPELRKLRPSWNFLFRKSGLHSTGHFQQTFNKLAFEERANHALEILIDLEILKRAKLVVCTYSSNICRLIDMLRSENQTPVLDVETFQMKCEESRWGIAHQQFYRLCP